MSLPELDSEISAGVAFWAYESEGEVIGVMGPDGSFRSFAATGDTNTVSVE
jgi:hypothetical protein